MVAGKTRWWRIATSPIILACVSLQPPVAVIAAEAPSRAQVNDAIERAEAGLARITAAGFDLDLDRALDE
jgi:hypothetical protein